MKDIFAKYFCGEMVSPPDEGYDLIINDIFSMMKTVMQIAVG